MTDQPETAVELAMREWRQRNALPADPAEAANYVRKCIGAALAIVWEIDTHNTPNRHQVIDLRGLLERARVLAQDYEVKK